MSDWSECWQIHDPERYWYYWLWVSHAGLWFCKKRFDIHKAALIPLEVSHPEVPDEATSMENLEEAKWIYEAEITKTVSISSVLY